MMMHFDVNKKMPELEKLKTADHLVLGFNAYFLIEVLYESITTKHTPKETEELVELINIHCEYGICKMRVDYQQMMCVEIKDEILADYIIDLYVLYKKCIQFLLSEYKTDLKSIVSFYKRLYNEANDELSFMDFMQAHRWFEGTIDYYEGKIDKVSCYQLLERHSLKSQMIEILTVGEVRRLAESVCDSFLKIIKKRWIRKIKKNDIEQSVKQVKKMYHD